MTVLVLLALYCAVLWWRQDRSTPEQRRFARLMRGSVTLHGDWKRRRRPWAR